MRKYLNLKNINKKLEELGDLTEWLGNLYKLSIKKEADEVDLIETDIEHKK